MDTKTEISRRPAGSCWEFVLGDTKCFLVGDALTLMPKIDDQEVLWTSVFTCLQPLTELLGGFVEGNTHEATHTGNTLTASRTGLTITAKFCAEDDLQSVFLSWHWVDDLFKIMRDYIRERAESFEQYGKPTDYTGL